ncbi:protein jagunal homolog 1 isoform X3 [Camellia sinensis]|uniref:protein jagunal homolog 1 isoform X3 n=1 Tax=Camellia sinensis TaxID=4442 RepID=UPI0010361826|nr:protein jagunal homolog 1 isoform X3 [Camellia sinensis]
MQQRKPTIGNGRPSGTDGSDFSYRMVVDSRYTKVAKGKSRLSSLIFIQVIVQLVGLLNFLLSILKEESLDTLAVSSIVISFLSLLIGELGRRRSRVNFLKFFMFASSMAVLISIAGAARSNVLVEDGFGLMLTTFVWLNHTSCISCKLSWKSFKQVN